MLLERQQGYKAIGEAVVAEDLLAQAESGCWDLVLLGWELPGRAREELVPALRHTCPNLAVIALGSDRTYVNQPWPPAPTPLSARVIHQSGC